MSREEQRDSNHILNSSENFTPLFFFYSLKKPVYCDFPIFVVHIPFMKIYYALILLSCFFSALAVGAPVSRPNGMDLCSKAFGGPSSHPAQISHLLADPRLLFGENFRRGQLEGLSRYFVVDQKSFNTRKPIGRIIKKTSPTTAIAEIIDPNGGTIHEMGIHLDPQKWGAFYLKSKDHPFFQGIVMQGRPDMELVFSAIQSKKESLPDLDTPFSLQNGQVLREGLLKDKGYSSAYTRHIDGMSEGQTLKRMWINGHVNPYRTHIPYLAKPLTTYIDYIKEGVRKLSFIDLQQLVTKHGIKRSDVTHLKEEAMERMEVLEKKAEKAIKENQLTYQRFLKLIFELSQVVQYGEQVPSIKPDYIEALLEYFPLIIAIPVKGEIGIMALNESGPQGVHPLGLSYEIKKVDGDPHQTPYKFTVHDFLHFNVFMKLRATSFNTVHELFHNRWIEFRESLPVEIRKNGELAYYLLTHEDGYRGFIAQNPTEMNRTITNSLNNKIHQGHNFKGLKDFSQDKETKVSEVARDWAKIFKNIKQELGLL